MIPFTTPGGKIVRHLFPRLDFYYFGNSINEPKVLKGEFAKAKKGTPIVLVRNFKNQLKLSASDKYGNMALSWDEILQIAESEISKDRPHLTQLIETFNEKIQNLQVDNKESL